MRWAKSASGESAPVNIFSIAEHAALVYPHARPQATTAGILGRESQKIRGSGQLRKHVATYKKINIATEAKSSFISN